MAGWGSAAGQGGGSQLLAAGKGALFGAPNYGPVTAAQAAGGMTALPTTGGILGTGSGLGGLSRALPFGGTKIGGAAYSMLGTNAVNSLIQDNQGSNMQGQQYMDTSYTPYQYASNNYPIQSIKSTPISGASSATQKGNLYSDNLDEGNSIVAGMKRQFSKIAQLNPIHTFRG
jgi:hypothetical protein